MHAFIVSGSEFRSRELQRRLSAVFETAEVVGVEHAYSLTRQPGSAVLIVDLDYPADTVLYFLGLAYAAAIPAIAVGQKSKVQDRTDWLAFQASLLACLEDLDSLTRAVKELVASQKIGFEALAMSFTTLRVEHGC